MIGATPETRMAPLMPKDPTEVVKLSYWGFLVWWIIILGVHVVTCVYTALYSYSYWMLQDTYLNGYLEMFEIGMPPPYHRTIAIVLATMSALHAVCILLMLGGSVWQRSLVFTPWSTSDASVKNNEVKSDRTSSAVLQSFTKVYTKVADRHGIFGVNGVHFHVLLIIREVIETGLQTVQAYRMSVLLPRTLLNRFYVILLVMNCWSSVLVYSVFFKGDEASRRFACIVLDCVLDLVACMGVELMVVLSYASDYDVVMMGFWDYMWRDDEWAARVLNEFRMVVVVSWSDLASRAVFSCGLILTTTNMKELLQRQPKRRHRGAESSCLGTVKEQIKGEKLNAVVPTPPTVTSLPERKTTKQTMIGKTSDTNRGTKLRTHCARLMLRAAHLFFGAWGIAVLGFHVHASVQPTLPQCLLQVRPWSSSRPSCYLVGLDCHTLAISGKMSEVEEKWSEFERSTVVQLRILHCPALEMPPSISKFNALHGVKVYNSTIVDWGESAAFTSLNHPNIRSLYLVRVNMTDGLLPAGFHTTDFPPNLRDFEFCVTNLLAVPDDLDLKWPRKAEILFEYSQLTSIPPVLVRLEPKYLAVTANPMTEVPAGVFEIPGLRTLGLGQMNLNELPRNVVNPSPSLNSIFLDGTNISFFWPWMDDLITMETWGILVASLAPYCSDLEKIQNGAADAFSTPPSPDYAPILMNPSEANVPPVYYGVSCDPSWLGTYYYIDLDDENMAISPAPALVRP
ncbi:hypothetical protein PC129_g9857 [Phytophthora cactorum]|uniref:Uncharacterized protein n=3 Tax=Phytophthora cactorum TaxID=29920 RepID=A0A8T1I4W0_9STRA|nr:hypothetical protein Pcac1_g9308 [Phytophthora cactorum]KAG2812076.1 hypothetical protein PC111_g14957 [Phytophthora cactorum]KAG2817426.1 hypothetical protein PC112_g13060 [Phytophthora cactorum]KAG2851283.1 hypothetical protein PC113_g16049 [Phytophthora cactorum]KAG2898789.1 hypothetical protein PC114_g14141 [Phytophthora cactorum]